MHSKSHKSLAYFMITAGVIILLSNIANLAGIDIFWPIVLVFVGIWFIFRPGFTKDGFQTFRFVSDVNKRGEWQLESEDMLAFVHDINYDFTKADIPDGETTITLNGFVTELEISLPPEVAVTVSANAFVAESKINGDKQEFIFRGLQYTSPNYDDSQKKINFEINSFVVEFRVTY